MAQQDRSESRDVISKNATHLDLTNRSIPEKHISTGADIDYESLPQHVKPRVSLYMLRQSLKIQILTLLGCAIVLGVTSHGFLTCMTAPNASATPILRRSNSVQAAVGGTSISSAFPSSTAVLNVFQVYQPVLSPFGVVDNTINSDGSSNTTTLDASGQASGCTKLLMDHSFGFSYGHPFVGNYTPPSCAFNRVIMNFTVTSRGRQFDRLALMYFGDTEVWRTSTAEPTVNGIKWTYMKDMSEYMYFWNQPQKIIFDLGNLIDDTYTGFFNTTLTATFFIGPETVNAADLIVPISARKSESNSASLFVLPADTAANTISFPQNANRAVFSVSACGQANEEFWWSNVLQSDVNTFLPNDGTLPGFSPWREVQLYIDGQLAGVQWPFPVIFTGGVAPGLWRPIVGIDTFDLREHQIDITPWLGVLSDGKEHTFEIKVAGILDDGGATGTITETVGNSWYVTGKIFLWLDGSSSITTGSAPVIVLPPPLIKLSQSYTQNATSGANETLTYSTLVGRSLSVSSVIKTQKRVSTSTWSQRLSYSNFGSFTNEGNTQVNTFSTTGSDVGTGQYPYSTSYVYPLFANTSFIVDSSGNFSITAALSHGLTLEVTGNSIYPSGLESFSTEDRAKSFFHASSGSALHTVQNGTAYYFSSPSTKTGVSYGSTEQDFTFDGANAGASTELYRRYVKAVNGTVTKDFESLVGVEVGNYDGLDPPHRKIGPMDVLDGPKAAIGRGPGSVKPALAQGG